MACHSGVVWCSASERRLRRRDRAEAILEPRPPGLGLSDHEVGDEYCGPRGGQVGGARATDHLEKVGRRESAGVEPWRAVRRGTPRARAPADSDAPTTPGSTHPAVPGADRRSPVSIVRPRPRIEVDRADLDRRLRHGSAVRDRCFRSASGALPAGSQRTPGDTVRSGGTTWSSQAITSVPGLDAADGLSNCRPTRSINERVPSVYASITVCWSRVTAWAATCPCLSPTTDSLYANSSPDDHRSTFLYLRRRTACAATARSGRGRGVAQQRPRRRICRRAPARPLCEACRRRTAEWSQASAPRSPPRSARPACTPDRGRVRPTAETAPPAGSVDLLVLYRSAGPR